MTNASIRRQAVSREDLLDVLLGELSLSGQGSTLFPIAEIKNGKLALGFRVISRQFGEEPPVVVVVGDRQFPETMSWLRTYASEAFPVSQYSRIVLASDWETFGAMSSSLSLDAPRPDSWASVAVGEALSQSDGDTELLQMPLSRIASCFSLTVGRTALQFGEGEPTRVCVDRLRSISLDKRLGRRPLSVDQMLPIWRIASSSRSERLSASNAAILVMEASQNHFRGSSPGVPAISTGQLIDFPGLASDSVEERVMAFNRLAMEVVQGQSPNSQDSIGPAIAAAAFLVGRSTSHAFLVKRLSRVAPTAFAWFGVIAAIAGPRAWDLAWLRAVKGAERLLRPEFSWSDAPSADIGWAEFAWLASTFDDAEQLVALPKMLPRTLGIEVVPGASFQVRLGGAPAEMDMRASQEVNARERALQDTLSQVIALAQKAQGMVSQPLSSSAVQQTFDYKNAAPGSTRVSRAKKTKRGQDEG